jgi:hypothetical protein
VPLERRLTFFRSLVPQFAHRLIPRRNSEK